MPTARIQPTRGPVGTRVSVEGECFDRENWIDIRKHGGYGIFLIKQFQKPKECELLAGGKQRLTVNEDGQAQGYFTIPKRGSCFQRHYGRRVTPAVYDVSMGCHACSMAGVRFTVTGRLDAGDTAGHY